MIGLHVDIERVSTDPDPYEPYRISQAMRVGDLLFVSGQAAIDKHGQLVGVGRRWRAGIFTRSPDLLVAGADGRGQRAVVKGLRPVDPAWSRDALRLAFASRGLSTVKSDCTGLKRSPSPTARRSTSSTRTARA